RCPRPPAPSTAQVRSGQAAAHASSRPACTALARTRSCPSGSSAPLTATAVREALCGSIPIITAVMTGLLFPGTWWGDRGGHAYFQDLTALAPLLSHAAAGSRQASTSFESQTRKPAGGYRATPARTSQRYDQAPQPGQAATPTPNSQVGGYRSRTVDQCKSGRATGAWLAQSEVADLTETSRLRAELGRQL